MRKLDNLEQIETGNAILLFSTQWCGDCIVLSNYIEDVVKRYEEKWDFFYVDRDQHLDLARDFNVFGIPSFVALNNSVKIADFISKDGKTYEEICNWIENIEENNGH